MTRAPIEACDQQTAQVFPDKLEHNPSWFEVSDRYQQRQVIDFCVPANPYFPPDSLKQDLLQRLDHILKFYPDLASVHEQRLSELTGLDPENLVACNGSTELITLICQRIAKAPFVTTIPTFGRWTDLPLSEGKEVAFVQRCEEREFRLSVDDIVEFTQARGGRSLIVCNPNNPTGQAFSISEVRDLFAGESAS